MTNGTASFFEDDKFDEELYYTIDVDKYIPKVAYTLANGYSYAKSENLNAGNYFLVDLQRLSDYTGLDKQAVIYILYAMEEMDLIGYTSSGIKNTKLVNINENMFKKYLQGCEQKDTCYLWDKELENKYKKRGIIESFPDATNEMKLFIERSTKNPEKIPLAVYSYGSLEFIFQDIPAIFLADENLREKLGKCINSKYFKPIDLINFIDEQCEEMQYWDTSNLP